MIDEFEFPELYELCCGHDLRYHSDFGSIRPWFYEDLKPKTSRKRGGS